VDTTNNPDTPPTLPVGPGNDSSSRASWTSIFRNPWLYLVGIPLLVLVAVSIGFAFWSRPYYALAPGSVRETTERVNAGDADVFLPEGSIGFVTVSLTERVTMWEYISASVKDSVDLVEEELINGDGTAEEKREEDRRRMQDSKNDASVAALEYLGYEVERVGLGVEVAGLLGCLPAADHLTVGDLILAGNGESIGFREDLVNFLADKDIGDEVEFRVDRIRTGEVEMVRLPLGDSRQVCLDDPDQQRQLIEADSRPMLGITMDTGKDLVSYNLPVDIQIESDRVGGPSAGLAFALAIIDVLSEGELTGGLSVATTGTISPEGFVGRVGGVKQKTFAARDAGVELFLVPADELDEALLHAGDDMEVAGVVTLEEAIDALDALGGNGEQVRGLFEAASG